MPKCTTLNMTDVDKTNNDTNITALVTLVNDIRAKLKGDYMISKPVLAIGSTTQNVANSAFTYIIDGVQYSKAAVAAGVAPGNDIIPEDTYGAVALDIDASGTVTIAEAAANATGYASAALAIAGIPAVASTKARMGTVTATKSDGAFTFGTTALNAANSTVVYTDGQTAFEAIGAAVTEV